MGIDFLVQWFLMAKTGIKKRKNCILYKIKLRLFSMWFVLPSTVSILGHTQLLSLWLPADIEN